ncbi:MAG: YicC/YloC family endoribonuclease [Planctomycetota bacterium]
MIYSMTGQGLGRSQIGSREITAEVRAVNNRHLKVQTRTSDGLGHFEPVIEAEVRKHLRRGSLQIHVQFSGTKTESRFHIDTEVVTQYANQCQALASQLNLGEQEYRMVDLLSLPGAITEQNNAPESDEDEMQNCVLTAVQSCLDNLNEMRAREGSAMASELSQQLEQLENVVQLVEERSPLVVEEYRARLARRVSAGLEEIGAELAESDLVREVLILADKADIREELVRLRSHFAQFTELLASEKSEGRKLDFLIQEMFRETNTIGSKANDAEIAQRVVDLKAIIEQMRELVQNVE